VLASLKHSQLFWRMFVYFAHCTGSVASRHSPLGWIALCIRYRPSIDLQLWPYHWLSALVFHSLVVSTSCPSHYVLRLWLLNCSLRRKSELPYFPPNFLFLWFVPLIDSFSFVHSSLQAKCSFTQVILEPSYSIFSSHWYASMREWSKQKPACLPSSRPHASRLTQKDNNCK